MPFGLYVHYPYCRSVCPYCDFSVELKRSPKDAAYTQALSQELAIRAPRFAGFGSLDTIYVGGGTPSLWSIDVLGPWLESLRTHFSVSDTAEITVELNPEDVRLETLLALRDVGVNRLSLGAQSLDDKVLETLGRAHSCADVIRCIEWIRAAGFTNWNVDLMHGVAGQTLAGVLADVRRVLGLGTPHLSTYELTIEPETGFGLRSAQGEVLHADDDLITAMYEGIVQLNENHGRLQYEVSTAALPGFESQHNMGYWLGRPYLALGTAAHGFYPENSGAIRYANHTGVDAYIRTVGAAKGWGELPCENRCLSELECVEDTLTSGLRLQEGIVPTEMMQRRFGQSVKALMEQHLMVIENGRWKTSERGRMLLNLVMERILVRSINSM